MKVIGSKNKILNFFNSSKYMITLLSPMKSIFIILMICLACSQAKSQCIDSTMIKPFYQGCDRFDYHPVCACGTNYFNACIAVNEFGVTYGSIYDGVCGNFDFSFFPNRFISGTSDKINFFIQFKKQENNLGYLYLIDIFGAVVYKRFIQTPFNSDRFLIDESTAFKSGIYLVMVESEGVFQVKKMVVTKAN